jgi:hypothetical protein
MPRAHSDFRTLHKQRISTHTCAVEAESKRRKIYDDKQENSSQMANTVLEPGNKCDASQESALADTSKVQNRLGTAIDDTSYRVLNLYFYRINCFACDS